MKNENEKKEERRGTKMTIEKAMTLTSEEYATLDESYDGFNKDVYINHQAHGSEETLYDFIGKGSEKLDRIRLLKNYNQGDDGCD